MFKSFVQALAASEEAKDFMKKQLNSIQEILDTETTKMSDSKPEIQPRILTPNKDAESPSKKDEGVVGVAEAARPPPPLHAAEQAALEAKAGVTLPDTVDLFKVYPPPVFELYNKMGYVTLADMMPRLVPEGRNAEISISRGARVSYMGADKSLEQDTRLVKRLIADKHTSPVEGVVFQFVMKIPIFVARQLLRHRTARPNEQSGRYTNMEDEFYLPKLRMQSLVNKQGSSDVEVPKELEDLWDEISNDIEKIYQKYLKLVNAGVAREVARSCLPVCWMTTLRWQMDLHNLTHFLKLRMAPDAQLEIRDLANAIHNLVKPYVPNVLGEGTKSPPL